METKELEVKASDIVGKATALAVTDQASYDLATNTLKTIKGILKEVEETFSPIVNSAHAAWKEALAQQAKHAKPLEDADKILRKKASDWFAAEEKRRRDEEERQRAEAKRKAEEEALARAAEAEARGDSAAVEAALDAPIAVAVQKQEAINTNGVQFREKWVGRVVNELLVPREFLIVDQTKINAYVTAMKDKAQIPGVEVTVEKTTVVR